MDKWFVYFFTIIFACSSKLYDDQIDFYNKKHGDFLLELLKIIIISSFTLIFLSDNVYIYTFIFFIFFIGLFQPKDVYFEDVFLTWVIIIYGIVSFILFLIKSKNKNIFIFIVMVIINGFPFFIQEDCYIVDYLNLSKYQLKDTNKEVGYNKLILRSFGIIISLLFIFFFNKKVCEYTKDPSIIIGLQTMSLSYSVYFFTSVINQIYVLYFSNYVV